MYCSEASCGLYSDLLYQCRECDEVITLSNSTRLDEYNASLINVSSILACFANGLGRKSFNDYLCVLDTPPTPEQVYTHSELLASKLIKAELEKSISTFCNGETNR